MPHHFLTLPAEVRNLIWEEYLELNCIQTADREERRSASRKPMHTSWVSALLVNRQVRDELQKAIARKGRFVTVSMHNFDWDWEFPRLTRTLEGVMGKIECHSRSVEMFGDFSLDKYLLNLVVTNWIRCDVQQAKLDELDLTEAQIYGPLEPDEETMYQLSWSCPVI